MNVNVDSCWLVFVNFGGFFLEEIKRRQEKEWRGALPPPTPGKGETLPPN